MSLTSLGSFNTNFVFHPKTSNQPERSLTTNVINQNTGKDLDIFQSPIQQDIASHPALSQAVQAAVMERTVPKYGKVDKHGRPTKKLKPSAPKMMDVPMGRSPSLIPIDHVYFHQCLPTMKARLPVAFHDTELSALELYTLTLLRKSLAIIGVGHEEEVLRMLALNYPTRDVLNYLDNIPRRQKAHYSLIPTIMPAKPGSWKGNADGSEDGDGSDNAGDAGMMIGKKQLCEACDSITWADIGGMEGLQIST